MPHLLLQSIELRKTFGGSFEGAKAQPRRSSGQDEEPIVSRSPAGSRTHSAPKNRWRLASCIQMVPPNGMRLSWARRVWVFTHGRLRTEDGLTNHIIDDA